ncbi:hypothetical protein EKH57_16510 [Halorubrum sp. BOL3-1]|nr:hypothetical protein EKH57_16510 [Halorubrum sp. BOL3-1]
MEHCFACDTDYGYLGTTPHEGSCPACGSSAVTPAGELSVVDTTVWESATGLSTLHVTATDRRARRFEFVVAARHGRGELVCLAIDGTEVPTDTVWSVPSAVATRVTAHGIRLSDSTPPQAP